MESSLCEKPERHASRRLSDHLRFEGQNQKVHSLVDKVYTRENLKLAWEEAYPVVPANQLVDSSASAGGAAAGDGVRSGPIKAGLEAARTPSRRKPVGALRRRVVSRLIGSPFRGLVRPTMSQ